MSVHQHAWKLDAGPDGSVFVVDTFPEEYPYVCECGAFTHHPETGAPCRICAPDDWARRTDDLVTLRGGHFSGEVIPRPSNKNVNLRVDSVEKRVQLFDHYRQSENERDVFEFEWNDWTQPLISRSASDGGGA